MAFVGSFLLLLVAIGGIGMLVAMVSAASLAVSRATQLRQAPLEQVCGRCGYSTRGLIAQHCPECGADLAEHAVQAKLRPRFGDGTRQRGMRVGLMIGTLCMLGVAAVTIAFRLGWLS